MSTRLEPQPVVALAESDSPSSRSRSLGDLTVALLYLILSVALTWPLVVHLADSVIGIDVDEGIFLWNIWWLRFSLFDLRATPFYSDFIFYPVGVSLVYYTLTLINGLLSLPLQALAGPVLALNVVQIGSFAATGFTGFLLFRYLLARAGLPSGSSSPAAFVGGTLFAFSASRMVYASFGSTNLTSLWALPLFVLALLRLLERPSDQGTLWKQVSLPILWFALAAYNELTLAVFCVFLAFPLFADALHTAALVAIREAARVVWTVVLTALGALLCLAPLLYLMAREDSVEGQYLTDKWGYADGFSADLMSFFIPTRLHPIFGQSAISWTSSFTDVNIVFLGYGAMALATVGAWRFRRAARVWVWSLVGFMVLSLGPILHVFGRSEWDFDGIVTNFPMPYILLHYLPFVSANRFPNRFSIPLTLALGVLVAFGAAAIMTRKPWLNRSIAAGLLVVTMADQIAVPVPLANVRPPAAYAQIASEPGDFSIVQLPLGWRNSYGVLGIERTTIQSYQWLHQKRMIGGNISRNPPFKFTYFADLPVFGAIARLEQGQQISQVDEARDREAAGTLVDLYDLRFVVVHRKYLPDGVEDYLMRVLPATLIDDRDGVTLYRVNPAPSQASYRIEFGETTSRPNRGDGWTGEETLDGVPIRWSTRSPAVAFLPRPSKTRTVIVVRAAPFSYPGRAAGRLGLTLNGTPVADWPFVDGFADYRTSVPEKAWRSGANRLEITVDKVVRPFDVLPADRSVGRTGASTPVDIQVESAGYGDDPKAIVLVDGSQAAKNRRGINLVVVNEATGRVEQSQSFDTFAEEKESLRMADFLRGVPNGRIVAVAVRDDGAAKLEQEGMRSLAALGIATDLRGRFRSALAAIGIQGAKPGTAAEAVGDERASVAIGRVPDRRTLGAAVASIDVAPQ